MYEEESMFKSDLENNFFDRLFFLGQIKCDVYEDEKCYTVKCDVPGVTSDSINVVFEDGVLRVKVEFPSKTGMLRISERPVGKFQRSFDFKFVDREKISASLRNGVLTIILPKRKDSLFIKVEDWDNKEDIKV